MATVTRFIPRPPDDCWRRFVDLDQLVAWMPNLRRVRVVTRDAAGLPAEAMFELASRSYSLTYTYDREAREVRWTPRTGARDAVSGSARFEPAEGGCEMTYTIEGAGTAEAPDVLVAAFARWMTR